MTDDLVAWLREQLDAEADLAQLLADRSVVRAGGFVAPENVGTRRWPLPSARAALERQGHPGIKLIDAYSPWRVLAEIEAKRKILDWHASPHTVIDAATEHVEAGYCCDCDGPCTHAGEATCECCGSTDGCPTVRCLALPYADKPGYREEWRP